MEEGRQIDQKVCGEFERAGDLVHGLLCIVAHDKRICRKTASCSSDTAPPGSLPARQKWASFTMSIWFSSYT
jgi:hypothetical protein